MSIFFGHLFIFVVIKEKMRYTYIINTDEDKMPVCK